jgi:hypothetical protein
MEHFKSILFHNSGLGNNQLTNEQGEKRTLLNSILWRKANWTGHILRKKSVLDAMEDKITEAKGVGKRITHFLMI